jgi:hypothetical protein
MNSFIAIFGLLIYVAFSLILRLLFIFFSAILYAFRSMLFDYEGEHNPNLTAEQLNHLFLPETTSETHNYSCMKTKPHVLFDKQGNYSEMLSVC